MTKLCECGCGEKVSEGRRFRHGHNQRGRPFSAEHRKKISESKRGKPRSAETRRKISEALRSSEAWKQKTEAQKGIPRPPETRQRISETLRRDEVGYSGLHIRLRREQGNAREFSCVQCGAGADQWALNHSHPSSCIDSRTGLRFSLDPDAYDPLCHSCHRKRDRRQV